jgi:hypothetical protein
MLRAFVDNLTVVHVQLVHLDGLPTRHRGDMQVLDAVHVLQRKGKALPLLRRDELIDIDRMNRFITLVIATTVAKGFPASGEAGKEDISHDHCPPLLTRTGRKI